MQKIMLIITIFFLSINTIYAKEKVKLSSCVDGDTIKILLSNDDKVYTVRMLAVDTPESVHPTKKVEYYGKEASEYTCNLVTNAKQLEIEYDENSDKLDKYDRLLVWVFVDGELLQQKLIENGYAKIAYLYGDYKYTESLESIQEQASTKNIGIWDEAAKEIYNNKQSEESNSIKDILEKLKSFSLLDYLIIITLIIIIIFSTKKSTKNKSKKLLKKYFK